MASRFALAKDHVLRDLEAVIVTLYHASPRHRRRQQWNVRNPFRAKSRESQMVIWLTGARRGGWTDFVSGDKGDAVDLVCYGLEGGVSAEGRIRAVEWIEDRYGIASLSVETKNRLTAEASAKRKMMEAKNVKARESSITRARKMFFACRPDIRGTVVETYLASRGILLDDIPNLCVNTFRFAPSFENWMDAPVDDDGNKTGKGRFFPALISAMVTDKGRLAACHATYIAPDGRDKAPVDKAKLMWPETATLVIRCTQGPSGLTLEKAGEADVAGVQSILGITEGVEDALSLGMTNPELRMWAAGSLSGLLSVPDHKAISGYVVFKDNDWGKPQAAELFRRAIARLEGFRKPVEVVSMPANWGKDVNDAIRAG